VIEPRNQSRGHWDNLLEFAGVKADGLILPEGISAGRVMAMHPGHHRGPRAEHAFKGVARELGRSNCLLVSRHPEAEGHWEIKSPGVCRWLPDGRRVHHGTHKGAGAHKVSGDDSEQRRNLRWTFGSLSGS